MCVSVNSLQCNQCKYGLLGFCLSNSVVNCSTNTSVCFTRKTSMWHLKHSAPFTFHCPDTLTWFLWFCFFSFTDTALACYMRLILLFFPSTAFTSISSSLGFNSQGCTEPANCNNINGTLLGVDYQSSVACCSTDKCNPTTISGAPATKMTFAGLIAAATLASVWANLI